jgi:formylmethanofuran dehydrogenase subunit E
MDTQKAFVSGTSPVDRIGIYAWEEYIKRVNSFHGYAAPGVIIGGIMINIAMERIPKGILFNVICETAYCLPDAVQLLTPCTVGNGWLKIIDLGRFAVSLYGKNDGKGVRIYLDAKKLQDWDEIKAWFLKLKDKKEQNVERLREQIRKAGCDIYKIYPVRIKPQYLIKRSKGSIGICNKCGEAYPVKDGTICRGCQGNSPYDVDNSSILQ